MGRTGLRGNQDSILRCLSNILVEVSGRQWRERRAQWSGGTGDKNFGVIGLIPHEIHEGKDVFKKHLKTFKLKYEIHKSPLLSGYIQLYEFSNCKSWYQYQV